MADPFDLIRNFEGFRSEPYWDVKRYSIGYGRPATSPGERTTREAEDNWLTGQVGNLDQAISKAFPGVTMTPEQKASLISFSHNVGPGWMTQPSRLSAAVKAGDWPGASSVMREYRNAGGQPNPGLDSRRAQESALLTGSQSPPSSPPSLSPQGRPMADPILPSTDGYTDPAIIQLRTQWALQQAKERAAFFGNNQPKSALGGLLSGIGFGLNQHTGPADAEAMLKKNSDVKDAYLKGISGMDPQLIGKHLVGSGIEDLQKIGVPFLEKEAMSAFEKDQAAYLSWLKQKQQIEAYNALRQSNGEPPLPLPAAPQRSYLAPGMPGSSAAGAPPPAASAMGGRTSPPLPNSTPNTPPAAPPNGPLAAINGTSLEMAPPAGVTPTSPTGLSGMLPAGTEMGAAPRGAPAAPNLAQPSPGPAPSPRGMPASQKPRTFSAEQLAFLSNAGWSKEAIEQLAKDPQQKFYDSQDTETGKHFGTMLNTYIGQATDNSKMEQYRLLQQVIKNPNVLQGPGEESIRLRLQKMGTFLGLDNTGVTATQVFNSLMSDLALKARSTAEGTGMPGAMSDRDLQFLQGIAGGMPNTPEANAALIKIKALNEQRHQDVAKLAISYARANNGRLDLGFADALRQKYDDPKNDLFTPKVVESLFGKSGLPKVDAAAEAGAAPAEKTANANPAVTQLPNGADNGATALYKDPATGNVSTVTKVGPNQWRPAHGEKEAGEALANTPGAKFIQWLATNVKKPEIAKPAQETGAPSQMASARPGSRENPVAWRPGMTIAELSPNLKAGDFFRARDGKLYQIGQGNSAKPVQETQPTTGMAGAGMQMPTVY